MVMMMFGLTLPEHDGVLVLGAISERNKVINCCLSECIILLAAMKLNLWT